MYKTSVKSNVDGITHRVTYKIIKMLKSTRYKLNLTTVRNMEPKASGLIQN